ncbi:MAG: hypothetical protein F2590_04650, partial [Actinobacteria bacterium]|nr:hypothetical protein [Actinomycetota bacterium]
MPIKKLLRKAKMFAPTRIAGALRRRAGQYVRKLQYRPGSKPLNANAVLFESFQGK